MNLGVIIGVTMNREDQQFWNGALKCAIKMERNVRDCKTLEQLKQEISYLRQGVEDAHINNFDRALNAVEDQRVID